MMVTAELSIGAGAAMALGGVGAGLAAVRCAKRQFGVMLRPAVAIVSCCAVAAALGLRVGDSAYFAPILAFGWAGVIISCIDLRTHLIPTRLLRAVAAAAVPLVCLAAALEDGAGAIPRAAASAAIGGVAGWAMMHLVWLAARGSLGYGDVRLGGYLGLHLGLGGLAMVLSGLLAGFVIAAVLGAAGVVALGRSTDHRFALGPSLVAGALVVIWWSAPTALAV